MSSNLNPYGTPYSNGYNAYSNSNYNNPYFMNHQNNSYQSNQGLGYYQNQNNGFNYNGNNNNISNQNFTPTTNTNKVYVNGIDDVRNRQLAPNSDFIFLDNDNPLLYRKVVDSTGKMEIKTFQIVPYEDQPKKEEKSSFDPNQYVSKEDFDKLKLEIEKLKSVVRSSLDLPTTKEKKGGNSQ